MRCTAAIFPFYAYCYFCVQPLWHMPANLKRPSPEKLSHVIATNIRVIRTKLKGNIWKDAACSSVNSSRETWSG